MAYPDTPISAELNAMIPEGALLVPVGEMERLAEVERALAWAESLDGGIGLEKNDSYPPDRLWTAYTMPQFHHGYGPTIIEAIKALRAKVIA